MGIQEKYQEENGGWSVKVSGSGGGGGGGKGGGGGGGGREPEEDPESLRSRAEASVLAVIAEGEVQGFASGDDPLKRTYIDTVPIKNEDGSLNFTEESLNIQYRTGTQNQSAIPDFDDVRTEQSVGVRLTKAVGAVARTTFTSLIDRVRIRVGIGSLFEIDTDSGDVKKSSLKFSIKIRPIGGIDIVNENKTINGKSRGPVDFEYEYELTGNGPWIVTLERLTDDPNTTNISNDLFWKAIVGIYEKSFRYPNSALIGVKVDAEKFTSVPRVAVEILGTKIKVPSNYDAESRSYSGIWDGTFQTVYSNNPAWVFYDLLTNTRYGAGEFVTENDIDIYSLYSIAQHCDELVPDGRGGSEPRFTFNAYVTNRAEAYEVLNALAAAFRGMLYFSEGTIVAIQDKIKPITKIFSPANVIQEVDDDGNVASPPFQYEGTARKARKTVALVSWNDPDDLYKAKIEYVEDRAGIDRYGYREVDVRAFGTTSQGQAQRIGRWTLLSDQLETEIITFKVATEGFFILPGEVIGVADPAKGGKRYGGRVVGSTTSSISIDSSFIIVGGSSYQASVMLPDGSVETRAVTNSAGSTTTLSLSPALSAAPVAGAPWVLQEDGDSVRKFRVISVSEDSGQVTVLGALYDESKFNLVDNSTYIGLGRQSTASVQAVPSIETGSIILESY